MFSYFVEIISNTGDKKKVMNVNNQTTTCVINISTNDLLLMDLELTEDSKSFYIFI